MTNGSTDSQPGLSQNSNRSYAGSFCSSASSMFTRFIRSCVALLPGGHRCGLSVRVSGGCVTKRSPSRLRTTKARLPTSTLSQWTSTFCQAPGAAASSHQSCSKMVDPGTVQGRIFKRIAGFRCRRSAMADARCTALTYRQRFTSLRLSLFPDGRYCSINPTTSPVRGRGRARCAGAGFRGDDCFPANKKGLLQF